MFLTRGRKALSAPGPDLSSLALISYKGSPGVAQPVRMGVRAWLWMGPASQGRGWTVGLGWQMALVSPLPNLPQRSAKETRTLWWQPFKDTPRFAGFI